MIAAFAWRTALGSDVAQALSRLREGDRAQRIAEPPRQSRHARFLDRMGLFALEAGLEAAGLAELRASDRTGVFAGVPGLRPIREDLAPALADQLPDGAGAWARGLSRLHPFFVLRHLSNNAQALLAAELGARGDGACFGGATAGAQALGAAERALDAGVIDAAVVIAYDSAEVESAAAIVLKPQGIARIEAACGADPEPLESGAPRREALERIALRLSRGAHRGEREVAGFGALGAAAAPVHAIAWTALLRRGMLPAKAAVIASGGSPGLVAAVRVELP